MNEEKKHIILFFTIVIIVSIPLIYSQEMKHNDIDAIIKSTAPESMQYNQYTVISIVILIIIITLKFIVSNTAFFKRENNKDKIEELKELVNDLCIRMKVIEELFDQHVRTKIGRR